MKKKHVRFLYRAFNPSIQNSQDWMKLSGHIKARVYFSLLPSGGIFKGHNYSNRFKSFSVKGKNLTNQFHSQNSKIPGSKSLILELGRD